MTWETSVFPICYHPMCCVLAFRTTRSYFSRLTQRLLLRFALSADLESSDRPRGSIPGSVSAAFAAKSSVTWESHVFQVCSSPVATQYSRSATGAPRRLRTRPPPAPHCSLDKGRACAKHIQLRTQTCARAGYGCTLTSAHISKCMQTQDSLGNMKISGSHPCWHKQ